jgi:hypothetical protein
MQKNMMKINCFVVLLAAICLSLISQAAMADAASAQLRLKDIVTAPVDLSISGTYYSVEPGNQKMFSVDVSQDRFIKTYDDGLTIVGVKVMDSVIYYIIDNNKKAVLKVSQPNLYKTGQFFNWYSITSLINLPGDSHVTALDEARVDCTMYAIADAGVKLCVDASHHIPLVMEHNGTMVARVSSVKSLSFDLKAKADSLILVCKQQDYTFIDVDSDMDPNAD